MKFIYPAVFQKQKDGTYNGYFPDLDGCTASGDTLEEAVSDAHDSAETWISIELEEELPLPSITDLKDIVLKDNEEVRNICVTMRFYEGWDE